MARPRGFNYDQALTNALGLFWEHGYDGVSLAELAAAMKLSKSSLYAAFGDKAALFQRAVELYDTTAGAPAAEALASAETARAAIEALLRLNASNYTIPGQPAGCMIVLSATVGSTESLPVRRFLARYRRSGEQALEQRIRRGIATGELPVSTDAAALAAFYDAVLQGMSIHARDGAGANVLNAIVDLALAAWPVSR